MKTPEKISIKLTEDNVSSVETSKLLINNLSSASVDGFVNADYFDKLAAKCQNRSVRKYYRYQAKLLRNFLVDRILLKNFTENVRQSRLLSTEKTVEQKLTCDQIVTNLTIAINVFLFIIKIVASVLSGSLSIISSVVDSAVDLTSGAVVWFTSRAIKNRDPYLYPRGRTRLEPLAVVVVSVIMGVASLQIVTKSLEAIITNDININVEVWTISIMIFTICTKCLLYIVCQCFPSPSTNLLAQDHRNDCISNTIAIGCALLGYNFWKYLDPIGAVIVSLCICCTWCVTGNRNIRILSGKSAKPEFYSRIIKIAVDHEPNHIKQIDNVQIYHLGNQFLVEVDIVLDKNMPLHQAHDISEQLQRKIEHLPYVERSFVHVDYETSHRPDLEHKVV